MFTAIGKRTFAKQNRHSEYVSQDTKEVKIAAAFRGMHVSPAKHSYGSVTDGRTDGQTDDGQSDPCMCRYASQATQK